MNEMIVPEGLVQEFLGVHPQPFVRLPLALNIGVLNALGQKWINAPDLLRALRSFANHQDIPLLHLVADQLEAATGSHGG